MALAVYTVSLPRFALSTAAFTSTVCDAFFAQVKTAAALEWSAAQFHAGAPQLCRHAAAVPVRG